MRRFIVYIKLRKKYVESIVAEGVEFTNENIALHEFLTTTILILDSMESIYKHYEPLGKIRVKWFDFDNFDKKVH